MLPINLFLFTRPSVDSIRDLECYEKHFSCKDASRRLDSREYITLKRLVELLINSGVDVSMLDGFYYSFTIPQIHKEFDLLKIYDDMILNIELKSEMVDESRIVKQLLQNRHYLLCQRKSVKQFVFVFGCPNKIYKLDNKQQLTSSSIVEIKEALTDEKQLYTGSIENIFRVRDYLVSPLDTPDKFVNGQYFLTDQQEEFKDQIIKHIQTSCENKKAYFCQIGGKPGTGKTLLLYDIAKYLSKQYRTCIIHCAQLSFRHFQLDKQINNLHLIAVKEFTDGDWLNKNFDAVIVDEAQRIYTNQLNALISCVKQNNKICIIGCDAGQMLSKSEVERNSPRLIADIPDIEKYTLSNRIRTNQELSDFIKILLDNQEGGERSITKKFPNVTVVYADDFEETKKIIGYFIRENYTHISFTKSLYNKDGLIYHIPENTNTHEAIGHEYDNVLMVLTNDFQYNEKGRLTAKEHPNPDYLFPKLFYQGITRAREKLALIVVQNMPLFLQITKIFNMEK